MERRYAEENPNHEVPPGKFFYSLRDKREESLF